MDADQAIWDQTYTEDETIFSANHNARVGFLFDKLWLELISGSLIEPNCNIIMHHKVQNFLIVKRRRVSMLSKRYSYHSAFRKTTISMVLKSESNITCNSLTSLKCLVRKFKIFCKYWGKEKIYSKKRSPLQRWKG
jgi:hypothetical protein